MSVTGEDHADLSHNLHNLPFFFAAKLVCCVLVSIVNQVKLSREHIHSIPNEQVLWMEVVIFGPSQKYSLVFYIKLQIETNTLVVY